MYSTLTVTPSYADKYTESSYEFKATVGEDFTATLERKAGSEFDDPELHTVGAIIYTNDKETEWLDCSVDADLSEVTFTYPAGGNQTITVYSVMADK